MEIYSIMTIMNFNIGRKTDMNEETKMETMEAVTEQETISAEMPVAASEAVVETAAEATAAEAAPAAETEAASAEPTEAASETKPAAEAPAAAKPEVVESMDDYAAELEASFKEFDEKRSRTYVEEESPDAEKWQELRQMLDEKTIIKVKVKEIVKGGAIAYVDEMKAFIPASQLSLGYVENLEEFVGKHLEVRVITADPEAKRLVLSAKDILKERQEAEKAKKLESYKAGDIVEGTVDSIKPYGAFINLEGGVSGLLHISQISTQRIKHPSVVLKEGQTVKVKILSVADGKISLSMRVLEEAKAESDERIDFDYKGDGAISTGLGDLLKGFKL